METCLVNIIQVRTETRKRINEAHYTKVIPLSIMYLGIYDYSFQFIYVYLVYFFVSNFASLLES